MPIYLGLTACPDGSYGPPDCEVSNCPTCKNGGTCYDLDDAISGSTWEYSCYSFIIVYLTGLTSCNQTIRCEILSTISPQNKEISLCNVLIKFNNGYMPIHCLTACPDGSYGPPECEGSCPKCRNGGTCYDLDDACVCPPGYSGYTCEVRK